MKFATQPYGISLSLFKVAAKLPDEGIMLESYPKCAWGDAAVDSCAGAVRYEGTDIQIEVAT